MNATVNPLRGDLNYILDSTHALLSKLKSQRIFITGGTGFVGRWFLESLIWANQKLNLSTEIVVLTRNIKQFQQKVPHIATNKYIEFIQSDITDFVFPSGVFNYVIHAAADISTKSEHVIINGTRRALDFALQCKAKRFLLISSGAVYGKQSPEVSNIAEDYVGNLDSTGKYYHYALGKRAAEQVCIEYNKQYNLDVKIARGFTFLGPYLPFNRGFAVSNFISDKLNYTDIIIEGDGTTVRSYLYAADMIIWLWHILLNNGKELIYNVGSDQAVSILELAKMVAENCEPKLSVKVLNITNKSDRYIPSVARIKNEFELINQTSLQDAIQKTIKWMRFYETK